MKRVNPITKLFRKTKKSVPVATPASDIADVSVSSRGANVPTLLGVVKAGVKVANAASSLWPPLQAITSVLEYFINNHEAWLKNQTATIYLVGRLRGLEKLIFEGETSNIHDRFAPRIRQLERDLQGIKDRAIANQYLASSEIADALNEIVKDIGDVILDYQTSLQKALLEKITQHMATDDQKIIQSFPRARDANHLSEKHRLCLPGTRTKILLDLEAWARDHFMKRTVYWLNGHAGSGKSTIAQSFCHQAFADGILGASFFCSRDTEARSDLDMIFPTLSFQLACRFPEICSHVVEVLKSRPDAAKESLNSQLETLLIEPLEQSSLSTIIVIDALDECKDSRPTSIVLSLLSQYIQRIPHVKWFITGRPEPVLRQGFRTPGLRPITETCILHDVTISDIDHDISLYLATHLSEGFQERSALHLPEIWPPDGEIQALTIKCGQLFIFASTAVAYIQSPYHHPFERLSSLCHSEGGISEHGRLGLDQLYTAVLEVGYGNASSADHERIMAVIAAVVLALNHIPVDNLAELLNIEASTITTLLRMLHAVLRVPQSNDRPTTLYYKSFYDYITDPLRCRNTKFCVNPSIQHCMLVDRFLELMNSRLKRNLCSLPRYAMNADLELTERQQRIGGALVYTCSSWVAHLTLAKISAYTLSLLGVFLKEHFIHWMELMSLVETFTFAIQQLHDVHDSLIAIANTPEAGNTDVAELLNWIYDGRKLASEFREAVQMSASHLYHSALPLSPEGSLLRNSHSTVLESEVKIIYGNLPKWSHADVTISLPHEGVSGQLEWEIRGSNFIQVEWLCEDTPSLIALSDQGIIQELDVASNTSNIIYQGSVHSFCLSLKHSLIAICAPFDTVYLMDFESCQILHQFPSLGLEWSNFAFSPLQPLIALDGRFFDIKDPTKPQRIMTAEDITGAKHIEFSPTQHVFVAHRGLSVDLIPTLTTGSHFLLPIGSPIPPSHHAYSYERVYIFRQRQFLVSPDASKVVLITGKSTETKLHLDEVGVTKTVIDIQRLELIHESATNSQEICAGSIPSKLERVLRATCPITQPGLPEMEALGIYWQAPILNLNRSPTDCCCFATTRQDTLVFVIIGQNHAKWKVIAYSLDKEKILAHVEWDASHGSIGSSVCDIVCITSDASTGTLTMFTRGDISGDWRVVQNAVPAKAAKAEYPTVTDSISEPKPQDTIFSHALAPIPSDTLLKLNSDLINIYTTHSSAIQYPVLCSDDGQWIMNHIGQRILWVPYRVQARDNFHWKWRWCRKRLFVASDKGSPDPLIVDFAGVDANIPTALQVFEKLGWNRIVISDMAKLEEEQGDDVSGSVGSEDEAEPVHSTVSEPGGEDENQDRKGSGSDTPL